MGAEASTVAGGGGAAPAGVNPCEKEMETYIKCVDAKNAESGGLRDGDECEKESEAYRECRRIAKELRAAQRAANK